MLFRLFFVTRNAIHFFAVLVTCLVMVSNHIGRHASERYTHVWLHFSCIQ